MRVDLNRMNDPHLDQLPSGLPSGDVVSTDHEAFEKVVKQNERYLFSLLYSLTGNADEALDLTQETFIRVYRRLHLYDPDRPFKNWLLTIARNLYKDSLRKKRITVSLDKLTEEKSLFLRDPQADTERSTIEGETRSFIRVAMQMLNPEEREVLVLKDMSGMNYSEIARLLNIPAGTVASRVYYARRSLRILLEENGVLKSSVTKADSLKQRHSRQESALRIMQGIKNSSSKKCVGVPSGDFSQKQVHHVK